MFYSLINILILLIISMIISINSEKAQCTDLDTLNFSECKLPIPFITTANREPYCNSTLKFLNCMSNIVSRICDNSANKKSSVSYKRINRAITQYNITYNKNCLNNSPRTQHLHTEYHKYSHSTRSVAFMPSNSSTTRKTRDTSPLLENSNKTDTANETKSSDIGVMEEDECASFNPNKCESRSLHITCGYPAANPNSNLNNYCNELRHYIRCARCKTQSCTTKDNINSIRKHLASQEVNLEQKCHSQLTTSSVSPPTTTIVTTTFITSVIPSSSTTTSPITEAVSSTEVFTSKDHETTITTNGTKIESTSLETFTAEIIKAKHETLTITLPFILDKSSTEAAVTNTTSPVISSSSPNSSIIVTSSISTTTEATTKKVSKISINSDNKELIQIPTMSVNNQKTSIISVSRDSLTINNTEPITTRTTLTTTTTKTTTTKAPTTKSTKKTTITTTNAQTTKRSKVQEQLDKIISEQTSLIKSRNKTKLTTYQTTTYRTSSTYSYKNKKIDHLLINFDHIDARSNTFEVSTSDTNLLFYLSILNRTEIFKGIKNGAVYLHSKTCFILNLREYASNLCLTSNIPKNSFADDLTCSNGWTVSFWIKVSNLNIFDKTILKVDTILNNKVDDKSKYFLLKLSNYDMKIQFLFKRKLWTINQNLIWKSEWTMLTYTWSEFEGITVYVNDKKLICQQVYEYYSVKDELNTKSENVLATGKTPNINDHIIEQAFEKLTKRSNNFEDKIPGVIYIGLTNTYVNGNNANGPSGNSRMSRMGRKFFLSYKDQGSSSPQGTSSQNYLLASTFSEAILIDELIIMNSRINSKEIAENYAKEYTIRNDYDSVEEAMFMTTTDNKQTEMVPAQGALVKKYKENWYLSLNGDKQFVILPTLFDSCIVDAESLCTFGFSINVWVKFTYNFIQYPIGKNFEQILFFAGSQDFVNGIEAILYIYSNNEDYNEKSYHYIITVNFKNRKYTITKNFRVHLSNIVELNSLNCLTLQFSEVKNLSTSLSLMWMNRKVEEIDGGILSARINENSLSNGLRSYSAYSVSNLVEYGIKSSVLATSNSIAIIGDVHKQSYFNLKNFQLRNHETTKDRVEYDYHSMNPVIYEFSSLEKLFKLPNLKIIGAPQVVDTRYGKSLLFTRTDQKITISNVTDSCFGNLNLCKNGYTVKMWVCFTNYNNLMKNKPTGDDTPTSTFKSSLPTNSTSRKIYLLTNGGQKRNRNGLSIIYDLNKNQFVVYAKSLKKWYKVEVNLKLKLYVWYIMTITWDQLDGLRLYINNKLLDHNIGFNYTNSYSDDYASESLFTLGKADYEFEELNDQRSSSNVNRNTVNVLDNQTEDNDKNLNIQNNKNYQISSGSNLNYYEFIIHKLIQYDVRKYPDEIISKNIIVQEKRAEKQVVSMNWLWYTISSVFFVIGFIFLIILVVIIKRRASNGFWSRENEIESSLNKGSCKTISSSNKLVKKSLNSKLCFSTSTNEEDFIDATKSNFNLELKQCHLRNDRFHSACDEFSTNSLYGTIDRLIVKKNVPSSATSSQSAILYTNNYNSITKDPKMRNTPSYIISNEEDLFEKSEIHF